MRTRQITLSDASIFCEFKNIKNEIKSSIMLQKEITQKLGIELNYVISTWDDNSKENYIGQINEWNSCYTAMKDVLDELNVKYKIDENAKMYGPSVKTYYNENEFSALQIDFEMTHRFDLKYKNNKNEDETPIYIHHTLIGSYENLLNVLIERYEGFFPFVIAPVQVKIIADDEIYNDYSEKILKLLLENGIRAEIDNSKSNSNEKFDKNLSMRIPYIVKIGKQEMNSETLMVTKVLEYEKQEKNIESNNKIEDEKSEIKYITKSYKIKEFLGEVTNCQTKF
jgi:threonyl-tRNA synthetase